MADKILKELTLKIWRQKDAKSKGGFETYKIHDISTGSSFLEMLDILNEQLVSENKEPVAFDHDCREGICGTCSLFIDGRAHGPDDDVTTCQYTCVVSRMGQPSRSSRGAAGLSR